MILKIIKQVFWLFLMSFLGNTVSELLSPYITIPGGVLGMVFMFLALQFGWVKLSQVKEVGDWLTSNMAILFVPAGVGLIQVFDIVLSVWWKLIIIVIVTVALLIIFVGKVIQTLIEKGVD